MMVMKAMGAAAGKWVWDTYGQEIVDRVVGEAKEQWAKFNWSKAEQQYRQRVRELYGMVRILGKHEPTPVAEVYTDVFILDKPTALQRFTIEELKIDPERIEGKRISGLRMVADPKHKRLFILGKPGAGKTTFLKHLALQAVEGKLAKTPIFVSLKAWSDSGLELMDFLVAEFEICAFPNARLFIETVLKQGGALVLFDGLDEVSKREERRERVITALDNFCRQYLASQALITCRNAAMTYRFEQFTYVEVADFSEGQMRALARKWFADDPVKREQFLEEFFKEAQRGLRELGQVPLLLSMICLTFEETQAFPQRRVEVYEEAVEALLKKWDTSRNIRRDEVYRLLSLGRKRQLLARLAAETFERGDYFIRQGALERRIVAYMAKLPPSDAGGEIEGEVVLKAIEAQHGLLIERARRIYSFAHLSLQAYFTAKYIVDNAAQGTLTRLIQSHLSDDRWREVFLLTASLLDVDDADAFFARFREAVDDLIRDDEAIVEVVRRVEEAARQSQDVRDVSPTIWRARTFFHALDLALAYGHYLPLARDFARALDRALTHARGLTLVLDRDLKHALAHDRAFARDRALTLDGRQLERLANYLYSNVLLVECLALAVVSDREGIREGLLLPPSR